MHLQIHHLNKAYYPLGLLPNLKNNIKMEFSNLISEWPKPDNIKMVLSSKLWELDKRSWISFTIQLCKDNKFQLMVLVTVLQNVVKDYSNKNAALGSPLKWEDKKISGMLVSTDLLPQLI